MDNVYLTIVNVKIKPTEFQVAKVFIGFCLCHSGIKRVPNFLIHLLNKKSLLDVAHFYEFDLNCYEQKYF